MHFGFVPLSWRISLHSSRIFLTHASWAYFVFCFHHSRFLFNGSSFFYLHALDTFCLVPRSWYISIYADHVFLTYVSDAFSLCLHRNKFLFIWVEFFRLIYLKHILPCTFAVTDFCTSQVFLSTFRIIRLTCF